MAEPLSRDRPIDPKHAALLLVDVQNGVWNDAERDKRPHFYESARDLVIPNLQRLIAAARRGGAEVMYTVIESLTQDGRDRSLDHKLSGFHFPKGSWGAQILPAVAPAEDDIVLPKTSSGLFNSTNFDYVLRNLDINTLVVTGFLTDQCVDHTIKDGADRGYYVICPSDACTTNTRERHDAALRAFAGYCRVTTTAALAEALVGARSSAG